MFTRPISKELTLRFSRSFASINVNGVHISNTLRSPLDEFHPKQNQTDLKNVSKHHWEKSWTSSDVKSSVVKHSLATWGPNASLHHLPVFVKGEGIYLYDENDKEYIDLTSQAVCMNMGHTVPESVKAAINDQLNSLPFIYSGLGICESRARLSNLLSELCPGSITGFQFPGSGGEANESAIRMARRYTGRVKIFNHYRSYHGGTTGSLTATGDYRRWMVEDGGAAAGFVKMHGPTPWHFSFGKSEDEITDNCLSLLHDQILMENPNTIAAVMMESLVGSGGVHKYPTRYVQGVRALCDKYGILLIMDEVMSGFGRTGKFWGFQHYEGVVPDIMTSAKGLSSSFLPLAMVGVSASIKEYFDQVSPGWGSTFHAHPVATTCAYATLKHMIDTDVMGNVQNMSTVLEEEVERLVSDHPSVARGRCHGMFACLDIVDKNGEAIQSLEGPPAQSAAAFKSSLQEHGVFNLLRLPLIHITPPLVINEIELRDATQRLSSALKQTLDKEC